MKKSKEVKYYKMSEAYKLGLISVGKKVLYLEKPYSVLEGIIGEMNEYRIFIHHDDPSRGGSMGDISPAKTGHRHSWQVNRDSYNQICFVNDIPENAIPEDFKGGFIVESEGELIFCKDKRRVKQVISKCDSVFRIFEAKEVKTKISIIEG
jgi:hypothetical protein